MYTKIGKNAADTSSGLSSLKTLANDDILSTADIMLSSERGSLKNLYCEQNNKHITFTVIQGA